MTSSDPERGLILAYAPAAGREALAALLALDDALALLVRTTREPALGQIRLAWWREALERLDHAPPPPEPVLQRLAAEVLPKGVSGAALAELAGGWDALIEERLDPAALARFAEGRGRLFDLAGRVLGAAASDPLSEAGQGWALADLARNLSNPAEAGEARALAVPLLAAAAGARWSRNGRPLGALAHLARRDLAVPHGTPPPTGSPGRVGRLLWHRLTGR